MTKRLKTLFWMSAALGLALSSVPLRTRAATQDQYQQDQQYDPDDPPSRVARLGYMEGSVSFQPAGEPDWVEAVANRPMTTGDKLWADRDSRAELQLGSAVIRLNSNTGFSFLNLDDDTVQIQLTAGSINLRVRRLDRNDVFEIDTPNLAFSVTQPGSYRVEASEDGTYTVISVREGGGESTGNGQTYTLHSGQRVTFSGTDSLNAEVTEIGGRDRFDDWAYTRDRRYEQSRSAQYLSHDVVGYEDLDDYGDWRDDSDYGHVWYPSRVSAGWAPYREGHWDWIPPWGYTWVDDSPWGYAPFHYGRWVVVGGRWGWVAGPVAVRPVYAPALVVFIGGGNGFGGNVGWFALGPREVYVPSYRVSRRYVERVNVTNTTVNNVQITNVYNTTIVNKTTNITNVNYVNRNVRGAVTAVPQRTFASAQPVQRAAVAVNERDITAAQVSARVNVAPTRESVLGARAATANRVTMPPQAVMNRQVIAKKTPPPPPLSFEKQQQALAAHPGQALARSEVRGLRPAGAETPHPMVKQAPPGKPATAKEAGPNEARRQNQPGNQPNAPRPGDNQRPASQPGNPQPPNERPAANPSRPNQPTPSRPNDRPDTNQPNGRREPNPPPAAQPKDRPDMNPQNNRREVNPPPAEAPNERPTQPKENRPAEAPAKNDRPPAVQPKDRPDMNPPNDRRETNPPPAEPPNNRPDQNRPAEAPAKNDRPPAAQRNDRPDTNQPDNRRETTRPAAEPNHPPPNDRRETDRQAERPARNDRPPGAPANNRAEPDRSGPDRHQPAPPAEAKPTQPPQHGQPKTPEQKKQEEERRKREEQQPPTA